ncbi:MAG: hypothetical protein H6876_02045 [Hyphomicrobiaceae bacterium]|nr:hypothetical protein [Hyphomicrobiaceae bacterium]MCC0006892.1 hypothetical protein [Hyphomicrobiaceae bacterium]
MYKIAALSVAISIALLPTVAEAKNRTFKDNVCRSGQKYYAKRCGGPRQNIPSYCLNGKRVAGGYYIKNGACYQDNGGGE